MGAGSKREEDAMSVKSEVLDIAREHGFDGNARTTTEAFNALADTLAGSDVDGGRTVASAIHALGPYIGGGGGGGVGAGFTLTARTANWSGVTPMFADTMSGDYIVTHAPAFTDAMESVVLPSGGSYAIGLPPQYSVSSVTISKSGGAPQAVEFTTQLIGDALLVLQFSIPTISIEDGYATGNPTPLYTVTAILAS